MTQLKTIKQHVAELASFLGIGATLAVLYPFIAIACIIFFSLFLVPLGMAIVQLIDRRYWMSLFFSGLTIACLYLEIAVYRWLEKRSPVGEPKLWI